MAARLLGHTLAPWDLTLLLDEVESDLVALEEDLLESGEAELFSQTRSRLDEGLQRSVRGLPLYVHEVTRLILPAIGSYNTRYLSQWDIDFVMADIEHSLRRLPAFRELHGDLFFTALPFDPMPEWILQPFGVPASYQPEGYHTGIDLRGQRTRGAQPPIYAVEDGIIVHVGPIYCLREGACRGPYAVILHHGNYVYTIYSHNSEATVVAGDEVTAGQMIARQGSEGYSRGPHLHLEVHVGSPYSGDWTDPWHGGDFVDPWPWLPRGSELQGG
jgi:murein DD-endopeptidase MepM/ murein hydrolase activator NlpD